MKKRIVLCALVALAACAPKEESAAPPAPPPPVATAPKPPTAPPATAPPPAAAPTPAPPPTAAPPTAPPPTAAPPVAPPPVATPRPRQEAPLAEVHLPAFTFRTMDHRHAKIFVNGSELTDTPCLWAVTENIEFDPKIPVPAWPPEGARFVGSTQHPKNARWKADVYLARTDTDDAVLYVDGAILERPLRGALRLRVEGYRYTDYTPLVNPEGEEASRLQRTIWFERIKTE